MILCDRGLKDGKHEDVKRGQAVSLVDRSVLQVHLKSFSGNNNQLNKVSLRQELKLLCLWIHSSSIQSQVNIYYSFETNSVLACYLRLRDFQVYRLTGK